MRRMGWSEIGPAEATRMAAAARDNFDAILASRRAEKP
jgi:hypothetical protein